MVEETKGRDVASKATENGDDDMFFINEDQFEDVVPQFGTCGPDAQEQDETSNSNQASTASNCNQGTSCSKSDCCQKNSDDNTTKDVVQNNEESKVIEDAQSQEGVVKNPCYKCKEQSAKYKNKNDVVCKDCLLWMLTHRFKNALVRYVRIQKDYPNLVAVSGGSNSMAMLHFLHCCLNGNTSQKKMFFKIHVLYIDEARGVYGVSDERADANCQLVIDACNEYGFNYTILPLERVYEMQRDSLNESPEDMDSEKYKTPGKGLPADHRVQLECPEKMTEYTSQLQALLGSLEASFAADVCMFLKKWLIADFCLAHNFKRVFMGTTGHKIATQLLGQLAKGRGASIFNEVQYFDDKYFGGRVSFCNPMKEFLQKEVAIWNHVKSVPQIMQQSLAQQRNSGVRQPPFFGSTDLLVEGFFNGLQAGYNVNTVPTVVRLTNKLQKQDYSGREYPFCPLCLGPRDKINNLLEIGSTIKAIHRTADGQSVIESVSNADDMFRVQGGNESDDSQPPIEKAFCFGCKRLCIETKCKDRQQSFIGMLPPFVKQNAIKTLASDAKQALAMEQQH